MSFLKNTIGKIPGVGSLVTGGNGLGVLNDLLPYVPGIGDAQAAEKQNKQNIAAAQQAMAFSERMSSTAYQRAMDDMKKAGLNPTLAYMQGGASAPSGVTPTINSESKSALGSTALSTALGMSDLRTKQQQANTQQLQAESSVQLNQTTAAKQVADAMKAKAETENIRHDSSKKSTESKVYKQAGDAIDSLINTVGTSAKEGSSIMKTFGKGVQGIQSFFRGNPEVKPASRSRNTGINNTFYRR